jgi:hypothetical protein
MSSDIKTINIKGKQYVEVAERLRLVHDENVSFEVIESAPYEIAERVLWRVVILVDGERYTGNAEVKLTAKSGPDSTSPFECGETSALGRALGFAGYGLIESVASADEVARAIADEQSLVSPLPTFKQMFAAGKEKDLWSDSAGFYAYASKVLGIFVDGGTTLSREQRAHLASAIDTAQPLSKAS